MSGASELLRAISSDLWVLLAVAVILYLRPVLKARLPFMSKLGVGVSGVSMEFAEQRLTEAVNAEPEGTIGEAAKRGVLDRLRRNADLLGRAHILWVDDHPENNTSIVELLRSFGASVDTPRSNRAAVQMLQQAFYDVVVSDVARDDDPVGVRAGLDLARTVNERWGRRIILFSARYNPATLPETSDETRLELVRLEQQAVFGRTGRYDEALHLIVDSLERTLL